MSISPVNDIDGHDELSIEINVPVIQDLNDNTYIDVGTKEPPDIIIAPDPDQSPTKKIKLSSSSVRQYFEANQTVYNPKLKKDVSGSRCKECGLVFCSNISTNLKRHLRMYHLEIFNKVESKCFLCQILLVTLIY